MSRRGVYLCHISIIKNDNTGVRVEGYAGSSGDAFFFFFFPRTSSRIVTHQLDDLYSACVALGTDVWHQFRCLFDKSLQSDVK